MTIHSMQSISDSGDSMDLYRVLSPAGLRRNSMSGGICLRSFEVISLQSFCKELDLGMRSDRLSANLSAMESKSLI